MVRPTECEKCGFIFQANAVWQAEARFILVTEGEGAARAFADEKLEEFHFEHKEG